MNDVLLHGHSLMIRGGVGIGKTWTVEQFARTRAKHMGRKFLDWKKLPKEERVALAHGEDIVHYELDEDGKVILFDKEGKKLTSMPESEYHRLASQYVDELKGAPKVKERYNRRNSFIFAVFDTLNKLPEDTAGIPVPVNGFIEWKPSCLFYTLAQPGAAGLLFLDEFMQAAQSVQKPLADLFLNKQISDMFLQDEVAIVAASNEDHDKCGTIRLLEHMKNRMAHCILQPPTPTEWCNWAEDNDLDPRVVMMIRSQPDQLYIPVANRKEDAFQSPRSWHITSDCIKGIDEQKQKARFLRIVATRVGSGAAARFKAVLDHDMSKMGPQILDDPELFKDSPWDRKVAFTLWLSGHAKDSDKILDKACAFLNVCQGNDLLDTMLYMMRKQCGNKFVRKVAGTTQYTFLREQLIEIAREIGGAA
jgi:MoxR-like ATPase